MSNSEMLLEVSNLRKTFRRGAGISSQESSGARFTAVVRVSFTVALFCFQLSIEDPGRAGTLDCELPLRCARIPPLKYFAVPARTVS